MITYAAPKDEEDRYEDWLEAMKMLQTSDIIVTMHTSKNNPMFKLSHDFAEHHEYR